MICSLLTTFLVFQQPLWIDQFHLSNQKFNLQYKLNTKLPNQQTIID